MEPSEEVSTDLSKRYATTLGLPHSTMENLKEKIKLHYDLASDFYLKLWGEHVHHGYWERDTDTKEQAQINLIRLLVSTAEIPESSRTLDVGCGIGGTSRYLAASSEASVTGITISTRQVEIAKKLTIEAVSREKDSQGDAPAEPIGVDSRVFPLGKGEVRFLELDAEKMGDFFEADGGSFDIVWIVEALSHFPRKPLFFDNAFSVLKPGGKLVLADWFKADGLAEETIMSDIKPIEDGMLLPPLCTASEYVQYATSAGFRVFTNPQDISDKVKRTWDITWSLIQKPSLWAFALGQGRDGIAFLQSFRAMRLGYANKSFQYSIMCFEKPV